MKNILFLFLTGILCLLNSISFAQAPEKFNYQAVIRDNTGELIINQTISVRIAIIDNTSDGTTLYREIHSETTSDLGLVNLQIGSGTIDIGIFSDIDWGTNPKYLQIEIDESGGTSYTDLGTFQLLSVPYALYANNVANKDDADADSTNEIQNLDLTDDVLTITNHPSPTEINLAAYQGTNTDEQELTLLGDTLMISNGNEVVLPYDSSNWVIQGNTMYYNGGNVGIGSSTPVSNLEVKDNIAGSDALFQVINAKNDTVFAVYPDGVKVFIDPEAKGRVGGFAISGRSPSKAGEEVEYMRVTTDSTRIYVNEPIDGKGRVGGFAISGRSPSKGIVNDYLVVTGDSTRIYVNDSLTVKGRVGGFAISGRSPSKGTINDYLQVTKDSTRIYIIDPTTENSLGGFAIREKNSATNVQSDYMNIGRYNSKIYSISDYDNQEYTSWNLLVGNMTKFTDTLKLMRAAYGNLSMTIPYGDFVGKILSSPKFEVLGMNPSKAAPVKVLSVGFENTSLGTGSGISITGSNNLLFSNNSHTTEDFLCGDENIILGYGFMTSNFEGCSDISNNNILIGSGLYVKGEHNVCIGSFAGGSSGFSSGSYNLFLGYTAGGSNQDGSTNIFLGRESGFSNIAGNSSVLIGNYAGYNAQGNLNICIGEKAGFWETGSYSFYIDIFGRTNLADQQAKAMFYGQFNADPASQYLQINAKLGIGGLWNSSYALYVTGDVAATGNITAASFIATMSGAGAYKYNTTLDMIVPDYVFDTYIEGKSTKNPNYEMLNLNDLKQYVIQNRHLPRVPSRAEIERDGIVNLQGLSMITLEKVEENTLYIIELEETSKEQQQIIETQNNEITELKNRLSEIEKLLMAK